MIGAVAELSLVRVLPTRPVERLEARFAVRATDPSVARAEAELGEPGGLLDGVDRGEEDGGVDPVPDLFRRAGRGTLELPG